jgi:oligoendopeptidase F
MKKRNRLACLLSLLLMFSLLLSSCVGPGVFPAVPIDTTAPTSSHLETKPPVETTTKPTELPSPEPSSTAETPSTEPTGTTEFTVDPNDTALIRWQNAGQRDYLPDEPVAMVPFSEMNYVRPDVEKLYAEFDSLTQRAANSTDAESLLSEFYKLYDGYISFYSMDSLANVLYSLDTTRNYYQDEYDYCESEAPNLEEKLEALYKAFAASPSRKELEKLYFTEGFFDKYDDYEVYTNPEYLRLSQEEAALLTEYRDLTADIQVTYQGKTKSLDEWMETNNYSEYIGALTAYYEQYNAAVGDVYVRLVKVRQQLAAALDYDSYADYSYDMTYGRDYTPEQGSAFLEGIRTHLLPVLNRANADLSLAWLDYDDASEESLRNMLESAAQNIGGTVFDAYRFMTAYDLCDIGKSPRKLEASFQTYLYDYEAPFVFLNSRGDSKDYTTFSHEFGHFTDSYYNYGANEDLETAETFSQAMEFLALTYTDTLSEKEKNTLLKKNLLDTLQTFVYQGAYADFESRVYALDPDEITLEKINDLYRQCCKDYGLYEQGFDFYYSQSWIDVLHFFEVPYYIISYCVSAETALQVYRLEAEEKGAGVAAYFRLLDRSYDAGVQQVMEDAKMESPFRDGVLEETAEFFTLKLGIK